MFGDPVAGLLGFEGANEFHLIVVAGNDIGGFDDVDEQDWAPGPDLNPGWGEQPFGDEGYGE